MVSCGEFGSSDSECVKRILAEALRSSSTSVEYLHTDINISTYQYTINCLNGYKRDIARVPYGHQQLEKNCNQKAAQSIASQEDQITSR